MLKLVDIAREYNISKSTARRRVLECFPNKVIESGKTIMLDVDESSIFADFMSKRGETHEPIQSDSLNPDESRDDSSDSTPATVGNVDELIQKAVHDAIQKERLKQYESEIESLKQRVEQLESENERLHKVIEREQMNHVGFWNRLGQKLLPHATNQDV